MKTFATPLDELVATVRSLRSESGCPWDRKQSVRSLKKYLQEEATEIVDAIDSGDYQNLCEELGDFLYLIVMLSEINDESNHFSLGDVISGINEKLIRRHPHVFGDKQDLDEQTLRRQWQEIKEREKRSKK